MRTPERGVGASDITSSRSAHATVDLHTAGEAQDGRVVVSNEAQELTGDGRKTSDSLSGVSSGSAIAIQPIELERFDDYLLLALIGHGGMAEIYLALHEGQNRFRKLVVIKRMRTGMRADPFVVQMFLDEARLAARFNHPHVVQTHEIGEIEGEHFLAMEYMDGQPLSKLLRRLQDQKVALPYALAARIAADALDGLHYAHELTDYDGTPLRLVHRDVSPHNIFVTHDGVVKLLDFGIAKSDIQESQTRTGLIKGKFAYIAPEQARAESYDRRADLWSMGVTLWELAAGRRLFKGPNEVATLQAALSAPIPRIDEVRADVPEPIQRVVDHALQRDPDMRLGTALEMKEILEEWLSTQGNAGSRHALRDLMKEAFGAEMHARRSMIREIVGRIQKDSAASETGRFSALSVSSIVGLPRTDGTPSAVRPVLEEGPTRVAGARPVSSSPLSAVPMDPRAPRSARTGAWLAVIAGLLVMGAVGALVLASGPETGRDPDRAPTPTTDEATSAEPHAPRAESSPTTMSPTAGPVAATGTVPETGTVSATGETTTTGVAAEGALPVAAVERASPTTVESPISTSAPRPRPQPRRPEPHGEPVESAGEPVGAQPPTPPAPEPVGAMGRLQLDAAPYAIVFLGSRRLGITPIDVELPAGAHTLTLRNPEQQLESTYRVTIGADQVVTRRVALE